MSYVSRLKKAYTEALKLPLNKNSKYVLFSDCHRGNGTTNDNFLKNQPLCLAALYHYYNRGFTYIELGDGDELWENRHMEQIIEAHSDVYDLLSCFHRNNRLYMLYGNHDIIKKKHSASKCFETYPKYCRNNPHLTRRPLMPGLTFHEGILLQSATADIFLTHGHQAELFNSTFWPISRFLVRHLWKPLERFGLIAPVSAAKNYSRMEKTEKRLQGFGQKLSSLLIAGHTHRPYLSPENPFYCNCGSCVHPYSITCIEIEQMQLRLIKWHLYAGTDGHLFTKRTELSEPLILPIK